MAPLLTRPPFRHQKKNNHFVSDVDRYIITTLASYRCSIASIFKTIWGLDVAFCKV